MSADYLMQRLRETEAILDGHFALSSGLHSDRYVQCARLLANTSVAAEVGARCPRGCRWTSTSWSARRWAG